MARRQLSDCETFHIFKDTDSGESIYEVFKNDNLKRRFKSLDAAKDWCRFTSRWLNKTYDNGTVIWVVVLKEKTLKSRGFPYIWKTLERHQYLDDTVTSEEKFREFVERFNSKYGIFDGELICEADYDSDFSDMTTATFSYLTCILNCSGKALPLKTSTGDLIEIDDKGSVILRWGTIGEFYGDGYYRKKDVPVRVDEFGELKSNACVTVKEIGKIKIKDALSAETERRVKKNNQRLIENYKNNVSQYLQNSKGRPCDNTEIAQSGFLINSKKLAEYCSQNVNWVFICKNVNARFYFRVEEEEKPVLVAAIDGQVYWDQPMEQYITLSDDDLQYVIDEIARYKKFLSMEKSYQKKNRDFQKRINNINDVYSAKIDEIKKEWDTAIQKCKSEIDDEKNEYEKKIQSMEHIDEQEKTALREAIGLI